MGELPAVCQSGKVQVCDCEGGLLRPALRFLAPPSIPPCPGTPALSSSPPQTFFLLEAARSWDLAILKGCGTGRVFGILFLYKPCCQEEKVGELRGTSCFSMCETGSVWGEREGS